MASSATKEELDAQSLPAADLSVPDEPNDDEVPTLATAATAVANGNKPKNTIDFKPGSGKTVIKAPKKPAKSKKAAPKKESPAEKIHAEAAAEHATTDSKSAAKKSAKKATKSAKKSAKKSAAKKGGKRVDVGQLVQSNRVIYQLPLNLITSNPGNVGGFREQELIRNLHRQGYRIFKSPDVDANHTLWTMLNGEPNSPPTPALRANAVTLIREFEAQLLEPGQNIHETKLIHPIQVQVDASGFGIISGLVRAFAMSIDYAVRDQPPGVIEGEINTTDPSDMHMMAVSENLVRFAASPMVTAAGFHMLRQRGQSLSEIARRSGRTEQTISNYLDLMLLPQDVQRKIVDGAIVMTSAREAVQSCREKFRQSGQDVTDEAMRKSLMEWYAPKSSAPIPSSKIGDDEDFDDEENEDDDEGDGGGDDTSGSRSRSSGSSMPRHSDGTLMKNKVRKFDDLFIMYMQVPKPEDPAALLNLTPPQLVEKLVAAQRRQRELLLEVMQISPKDADDEENRRRIEKMSSFTL